MLFVISLFLYVFLSFGSEFLYFGMCVCYVFMYVFVIYVFRSLVAYFFVRSFFHYRAFCFLSLFVISLVLSFCIDLFS